MNDDIMLSILLTLKDKIINNEKPKIFIDRLAEYIDWLNISEYSFDRDYLEYKIMLNGIRTLYALRKHKDVRETLDNFINNLMQ